MTDARKLILFRIVLGCFAIVDLVLLFFWVHDRWFFEEPEGRFLLTALDGITLRAGQVAVILSVLVGIYAGVLLRSEEVEQKFVNSLRFLTRGQNALMGTILALFAAGLILGYLFFVGPRFYPAIAQGGSAVLVTPDGSEIYVADERHGVVLWKDLAEPHAEFQEIPIGQETGTGWVQGQPTRLAFVRQTEQILVTDVKFNTVVVIERRTHRPRHIIAGVGFAPRFVVVTPDGHKAYVSSEQPIPTGNIAVIDLTEPAYPKLKDTKISVPSPEGMAIRGRQLYIATQSGAGHDPVFIVDTATDSIVDWVHDFAVGVNLTIVGSDGRKIYVARGNYPLPGATRRSPLGVIDLSAQQPQARKSIALGFNISWVAVTNDGATALVVNDNQITAIDTTTDKVLGSVPLSSGTTGLAVTGFRVYAWLPDEPRLFTFDVRSLVPAVRD